VERMPEPTTKPARQSGLLGEALVGLCSVIGQLLLWGGVVALVLICAFAFPLWSGYGRLLLATYGTASAGCIAVGLVLHGCARYVARARASERPTD